MFFFITQSEVMKKLSMMEDQEFLAWPMANRLETFGDSIFSRENKPFNLLFHGLLAE